MDNIGIMLLHIELDSTRRMCAVAANLANWTVVSFME